MHEPNELAGRLARASVRMKATRAQVWAALLRRDTIQKILPVREVIAEWQLGAPFAWTMEMLGDPIAVNGSVTRMEPERLLAYEYIDPHDLKFQAIENVHHVTIELDDDDGMTRVTVAQDNHRSKDSFLHAQGGWRLALHHLKALVERT